MQKNYWNVMSNKRFALYYYDEHLKRNAIFDRILNIFLARASSGSIATWAIWKQYDYVWAAIIILSQIIMAINKYLPFKKRMSEITNLKIQLTPLYNGMEYHWYGISQGLLSNKEINDLLNDFTVKWTEIDNGYFLEDYLPDIKRYSKRAEKKKDLYYKNRFGGIVSYEQGNSTKANTAIAEANTAIAEANAAATEANAATTEANAAAI